MDEREKAICTVSDSICTIQLYIKLAMSYADKYEGIELAPLVMALDEMEKKINLVDQLFNYLQQSQNQLET